MAEKMNKQQLEAPLLLPVVPVEKNKKIPAGVLFVSLWGLVNAVSVVLTFGIIHIFRSYTNQLLSMLVLPFELTDAEVAKANAFMLGYLYCSVPQAAPGTLALLLSSHRRRTRRALAYVVLAATVTSHCMYAGTVAIFLTPGLGFVFTIIASAGILFFAMGDLLGFLALLVGSEE